MKLSTVIKMETVLFKKGGLSSTVSDPIIKASQNGRARPSRDNAKQSLRMPNFSSFAMAVGTPICVRSRPTSIFRTKSGRQLSPFEYQFKADLPGRDGLGSAQFSKNHQARKQGRDDALPEF
ncbi:hypothetical protein [Dechloromonas denitrificans]|uniref:hypothetical protein n=1 Tax=Dechloromonas denitrificans TaxID=281362 RepID=UPI0012FCAC7F|nr:hypothetical protein [Dechloromonas denitrificans]